MRQCKPKTLSVSVHHIVNQTIMQRLIPVPMAERTCICFTTTPGHQASSDDMAIPAEELATLLPQAARGMVKALPWCFMNPLAIGATIGAQHCRPQTRFPPSRPLSAL